MRYIQTPGTFESLFAPFFFFSSSGNEEMINLLIENGADVNARLNNDNHDPLLQ